MLIQLMGSSFREAQPILDSNKPVHGEFLIIAAILGILISVEFWTGRGSTPVVPVWRALWPQKGLFSRAYESIINACDSSRSCIEDDSKIRWTRTAKPHDKENLVFSVLRLPKNRAH